LSEIKTPWYIKHRVPPEQAREWFLRRFSSRPPTTILSPKKWRSLLNRLAKGELKRPDYGNTDLRCQKCGCFLRRFNITRSKAVLERAENDPEVRRLISGLWCPWCCKAFFRGVEGR